MNKSVISDCSCLIALEGINKLDILQRSFSEIITTREGALEFGSVLPDWIQVQPVNNIDKQKELELIVDAGEASTIALALETANCVLIIDEKKGRKVAQSLNIEIIGTLRILLLAKQKGIIPALKPVIYQLHQNGFRLTEKIMNDILTEAGE